jgi:hypothetical protein
MPNARRSAKIITVKSINFQKIAGNRFRVNIPNIVTAITTKCALQHSAPHKLMAN